MSRLPAALLAPWLLAGAATAGAAGIEVESWIDPPVVRVGETAVFSVAVRTGLTARVRLTASPELENLDVVAGPTISDSRRWGTGGSGRTVMVRWRLLARGAGTARVGPVALEIGGEIVEAPGSRLEVLESTEGRRALPPPRPGPFGLPRPDRLERSPEPRMLLRAEVDPRRPWTGEPVVYTLWLYTHAPFSRPNLESAPRFEGFWVDEVDLGNPASLAERAWHEGESWHRVPLLRRLLFPLRPGRHEIPPIELSVDSSGSPFDARSFFRRRPQRLTLASEAVTVEARPLPDPPPGFSGAVGRLALDARLVPTSIALGEHATLEVEVVGRGNLQGAAPPALVLPAGLELLPAEEQSGRRIAGTELTTRRTWRHALVPAGAGSYRLPPVTITYFDPAAGEYRGASTPELVLDVAAPPPAPPPAPLAAEPAALPARRLPLMAAWAAASLLAVAVAAALARWGLTRRRSGAWLRRWRRQLEGARSADRPRQAAAMLEESWRDLLAERWGLPRDLPPASWEEALLEAGADPYRAAEVGALAAELQSLRHAPELSAVGALTDELIARSLLVARSIG